MGQTTMGIMWGVRVPEGVCMWDDENFAGLLDRWWRRMDGRDRYVPDYEPDAGVAGFWIAAGASGKDGLPILDEWKSPGYTPVEMTRAGVRSAFPKAYRNAVARWARFRRWCDTHRDLAGAEHFAQTAPSLWLVPTEVA